MRNENLKSDVFKRGLDYQTDSISFITYGISAPDHSNMVEVHENETLRELILDFLNDDNLLNAKYLEYLRKKHSAPGMFSHPPVFLTEKEEDRPGWYFFYEDWCDICGPFPTELDARKALEDYCDILEGKF